MSIGSILRQTVGAARRAGAKVESTHRALSQTLGGTIKSLRQVPGVGEVIRSFEPLAEQVGKFAKNAGQFSRGESLTEGPSIRDIEAGIASARRGLDNAQRTARTTYRLQPY